MTSRSASPEGKEASASNSTSKKNALGPSNSFINVLEGMSLGTAVREHGGWIRPAFPELRERQKSIKLQKIDIREANETSGRSQIHLFGGTKDGYSILVQVLGFSHYFYYPAPEGFLKDDLAPLREYINQKFSINSPAIYEIQLEDQSTSPDGKSLPFLKISLFDHREMRRVKDDSGLCQYRDLFSSPERSYEASVPYFLRFMLDTSVTSMTWLQLPKDEYKVIPVERRVSCCELEVSITLDSLRICDVVNNREKFSPLRILSFDIECDVKNDQMSDPRHESVLQIGNMVSLLGQDTPINRTVFTLGSCSPISGAQVLSFEDEAEMLMAWKNFFVEVDPDIVIGYNITQFDIPYLLNRAQTLGLDDFPYLGRVRGSPQRCLNKRKTSCTECPGYEGRLLLDIYHHIREHYPGRTGEGVYKLGAISEDFLGDTKENVHYSQIPILHRGNADTRRELALYCLKDAYLPLLLLRKLRCFEKEVKLARDACVPYNTLRVWRPLKTIAKRYMDAISGEYVACDPL